MDEAEELPVLSDQLERDWELTCTFIPDAPAVHCNAT